MLVFVYGLAFLSSPETQPGRCEVSAMGNQFGIIMHLLSFRASTKDCHHQLPFLTTVILCIPLEYQAGILIQGATLL